MTQIRKLLFYLFLTIVFLLGSVFYSYYLRPERIEQRIKYAQSSLIEKEVLTDQTLLFAMEKIEKGSIDTLFRVYSFSKSCHDNGILITVFKDSTIKFWSDNSVAFDYSDLLEVGNFGFLGNGWFEVRKLDFDSLRVYGLIKIRSDLKQLQNYF